MVDKQQVQQDLQLQLDEHHLKVGALINLPHQVQLIHSKLGAIASVNGFTFRTREQTPRQSSKNPREISDDKAKNG